MQRIAQLMVMSGTAAVLACTDPMSGSPRVTPPPTPEPPARIDVRMAFVSNREGSRHIYLANADGTQLSRLVAGDAPAFSSDGGRLAFHREGSSHNDTGVYVVNVDGTGERRLAYGRNPAWSPDDAQIVFDGEGGIFVVNSDASGTPRLLLSDQVVLPRPPWHEPGDYDAGWVELPAWSPDYHSIAFVRVDPFSWDWGSDRNVYVMKADGSEPRMIGGWCVIPPTNGRFACPTRDPVWSPTGALISLITFEFDVTTGLFKPVLASIGEAGWERRQIQYYGYRTYIGHPHWAGTDRIVFDQHASPSPEDMRGIRIFVLNLATGVVRQLVPDDAKAALPSYSDFDPVWLNVSTRSPWDY